MAVKQDMILEIDTLINKGLLEQTEKIVEAVGKQAAKTEQSIDRMGGAFKGVAAIATAYFSKEAIMGGIDIASDFTENRNKLEAVFTGQVGDADKFIDDMAKSLHLGRRQLEQEMADVGGMMKGMGFEGSDLMDSTGNVLTAAKDIASFYNTDLDSAIRKVTGGLAGETEGLKSLGIGIQDADMTEYADSVGVTWSELNNAAKAQLRLNAVMSKLKNAGAAGDAANTNDEYAAVERSISSLTSTITGDFFMATKQALLPALLESREFLTENGDAIVGMGEKLGDLVSNIIEGVGVIQEFVGENKEMITIIGEVALAIGSAVVAYKSVMALTQLWTGVQTAFNAVMMLNPIGLVTAAVVGLGVGLYFAYQKFEPVRDMVDKLWGKLKDFGKWVTDSKVGQMVAKLFGGGDKELSIKVDENIDANTKGVDGSVGAMESNNFITETKNLNSNNSESLEIKIDATSNSEELKEALKENMKKAAQETVEEHERNKLLAVGLT